MSFAPFSRLVQFEFRRFKGLSRIALIFILLIPLLYGGIYLQANWDLYANIDQVKVAVVNHDKPAEFGDRTVNGGDNFVDALKAEPTFDWQFLGQDDEAALEGLRSGEYFMIITVPEDFSTKLVSAGSYEPARAVLQLHRDDANGFVIGTLTGKAEDALAKTLDSTVSETYFNALFVSLHTIKESLDQAADGAGQLDDGLGQAADGVHQLNQAVSKASGNTDSLKAQVALAEKGLDQVGGSIDGVSSALSEVRNGASQVATSGRQVASDVQQIGQAVGPFLDFVKQDLPRLQEQAKNMVKASASLTSPENGNVIKIERQVSGAAEASRSLLAAHPELAKDANFIELTRQLEAARTSSTAITTDVNLIASASGGIDLQLNNAGLNRFAGSVNSALDSAKKDAAAVDAGFAQITKGANDADKSMAGLRAGAQDITKAARQLGNEVPAVINGVLQLSNALGRLDTAMPQLAKGAKQLSDGLDSGAKKIPNLSDQQRENLSRIMASPVDIEQTVDNDAKYYGRGLAPFFFSIALWIACVSTFLVVRTISGRALTGRASPLRIATVGFGPVGLIGIVGAMLMGLGVWALLGLDPVHPGLFVLLLATASLSFMALAYWIRLLMGSPQTAVFLIALILQLPASGGTFPVAMLNDFYQGLAVIAPMRYSVDAFRVAISGGSMTTYWVSLAVLAGILVVSLALTAWLVWRRQIFRMRDLHPPMVTSTSTADYAFSVRPR